MSGVRVLLGVVMAGMVTGCVTVERRVPLDAPPAPATSYVGGLFHKETFVGFGFGLRDLKTGQEYVIPMEKDAVGLVAVPPGRYRVAYWITFSLTKEKLTRKDVPETVPLGRAFDVAPGAVMLLGKWSADREFGIAKSTFTIEQVRVRKQEAVAALLASYPAFKGAPVACVLCAP